MTMKKKKNAATVGTVLHKVKDQGALRPWAEYMSGIDPWKGLDFTAEKLLERWASTGSSWSFFSAADPKNAKVPGFEHQHGLVVFTAGGARTIVEGLTRSALPSELGEGGYVGAIVTKVRHKGVGKYLLAAAERVISESHGRVFLFVSESNPSAQRFYRSMDYEEIARASDCIKPGNTEILLTKRLA